MCLNREQTKQRMLQMSPNADTIWYIKRMGHLWANIHPPGPAMEYIVVIDLPYQSGEGAAKLVPVAVQPPNSSSSPSKQVQTSPCTALMHAFCPFLDVGSQQRNVWGCPLHHARLLWMRAPAITHLEKGVAFIRSQHVFYSRACRHADVPVHWCSAGFTTPWKISSQL